MPLRSPPRRAPDAAEVGVGDRRFRCPGADLVVALGERPGEVAVEDAAARERELVLEVAGASLSRCNFAVA
jgi:hypothetical protein